MPAVSVLFPKDALESLPERSKEAANRPFGALFDVALMDVTESCRDLITVLEVFHVGRAPVDRPQIRHVAQLLCAEVGRRLEGFGRQIPGGALHEIGPDRQRDAGTGGVFPNPFWLVEA